MDRGAWWATVRGVAELRFRPPLSFCLSLHTHIKQIPVSQRCLSARPRASGLLCTVSLPLTPHPALGPRRGLCIPGVPSASHPARRARPVETWVPPMAGVAAWVLTVSRPPSYVSALQLSQHGTFQRDSRIYGTPQQSPGSPARRLRPSQGLCWPLGSWRSCGLRGCLCPSLLHALGGL